MGAWDIIKIFLVLFVLLGAMYFMLLLANRFLYSVDSKNSKLFNINVLSTQALMPKRYVSVVKIQDKLYILGLSDYSVNLIDKLDSPENIDLNSEQISGQPNFMDYLKKSLGR